MTAFFHAALLYILPFLFVLTLVVTIHELGHFLVARWLGVAVDRFAIGFGRPILSFTDKGGVEWRFGWIPLGGYVRFAGDAEASSTVPDAEALAAMRAQIRQRRLEAHARLAQARSEPAYATASGVAALSDDALEADLRREGVLPEEAYFHFKPVWVRALVVVAGPAANFVLAITLFAVLLAAVGETVVKPRVGAVVPGSAAARAGFMAGDLVTAIDGRRINDFMQLKQFVALRAGQTIRFEVQRGPSQVELTATPVRRLETDRLTGTSARLGSLGLFSSSRPGDIYRKRYSPAEAVVGGTRRTWDILETTVFYLGRLVRGLESGDQLGGPLRIAATSAGAAKAGADGATDLGGKVLGGAVALLSLAAVLSVGIGFMNLLPVPVLDGGHLLFYAYEAAFRRPLGARVQAAGYRVGLALLLGLMLFATWTDLQQLRVFKIIGGLFS
ncbi:MAG TPA: M50 family metallopeptidase [Caulobacteraceae bacterium]|nr:M50 family metallopeptidase [Caulobacteraceae bacterium]